MHKENNQHGRDKNRQSIDTEGQPDEFLKQDAGYTGTHDIAQIKAQIGQGIGLLPLPGGGIVRIQRIIGRGLDGLEQTCSKQKNRRKKRHRQNRRQKIHAHRDAVKNALRGYQRLNAKGIQSIRPGGILFTFSCSQAIDKDMFRLAVFSAAAQVGRKVRILHQLHQPADHPINIYHPEGEYLKGLVLQVE